MEEQTKKRIKNGISGVAYGVGTYAGFYLLTNVLPELARLKDKSNTQFTGISAELKNIITSNSIPTKNQISQLQTKITDLNELHLISDNDAHLESLVKHMNTMSQLYNVEDTQEQNYVKTSLVDVRDQLNQIGHAEYKSNVNADGGFLILGGALLFVCGYNAVKRIYRTIVSSTQ